MEELLKTFSNDIIKNRMMISNLTILLMSKKIITPDEAKNILKENKFPADLEYYEEEKEK